MLAIQRFLRDGGTLEDLPQHAISPRFHASHPNLVTLRYQRHEDRDFSLQMVRECRGIVLDKDNDWHVVARGYDKFFNLGEKLAPPIDWSTAICEEKVDGSLCMLYDYNGETFVATTGTPDGAGTVNGYSSFADVFWKTVGEVGGNAVEMRRMPGLTGHTLLFELCAPENRQIVEYKTPRLVLLGARRGTGEYMPRAELHRLSTECAVPLVRTFELASPEAIAETFATMSPLEHEGYVVVDAQHQRLKVKHPGYVAIHHAKEGLTDRAFVDIARKGEVSEAAAYFPDLLARFEEARARVVSFADEIDHAYTAIAHIESQKDFAAAVGASSFRCPGALFALRRGVTASEFIQDMALDQALRYLGYKPTKKA